MKIAQMLALAMLLGSIPFGHIAVRLRGAARARDIGVSIDTIRSSVGRPGLALVIAFNIAKGFVPVYLARGADLSLPILALVGIIAVLSHDFSYWLMFRPSGKGGSVAIGALLGFFL
jgi:acyl phosphate:glycerol-3-phosphate acyltransferase